MLITDLITKEFAPVTTQATVANALKLTDGYRLSHIPLFEGLTFLGNIPEPHLNERPLDEKLEASKPFVDYFFLTEEGNIFDAVKEFYTRDCNMIPVLTKDEKYLGYIMVDDVIALLAKLPLLSEPAAMLTVSIPTKKYSMSEVTKIVESNNGRIFGAFISGFTGEMTDVTIKFNAESLSSVVETFDRFEYKIKHQFFNDDRQDLVHDRYNQLMKFLDI